MLEHQRVSFVEEKQNKKQKIKLNISLHKLNSVFNWGTKNKVWLNVVWEQNTAEVSVTNGVCSQKWSEIFAKQKSFISKYVSIRSINFYRDHNKKVYIYIYIYRVSHELRSLLRESVPYVKMYRYNPKHLYPNLNGYGDNGQRSLKLWQLLHTYWLWNTY